MRKLGGIVIWLLAALALAGMAGTGAAATGLVANDVQDSIRNGKSDLEAKRGVHR